MSEPRSDHRVFIVNEAKKTPFVTPETLAVKRGDKIQFVVAGEREEFMVCPNSNVFRSIEAGEEIPVGLGSPPTATVRPDLELNSIHRYEVHAASSGAVDPILIIHE